MVSGGGQLKLGGDASDAADADTAVSGNGSSKSCCVLLL